MNYSKERSRWWSGTCYHKEQLDMIIENTDVRQYAYILHDKDKQDPFNPESELKKPHYHFLVNLIQAQRGSWFRAFASDDMGIVFAKFCRSPEGAYNYLIHDTADCRRKGKHLYDPSERVSCIETVWEDEKQEDEHQVLLDDIKAMHRKEISFEEFIQRKPKRIHMMGNITKTYDNLSRDNRFNNVFRILEVTYIYGQTDKGKTRYVMEKYGYTNVFRVTKYDHTAFDGYRGQDVIMFEEFRSSFKIEEMLNYLDGYPLQLPSRYIDKEAAYTKVFIVTNWALHQQYPNVQTEHPTTWQAFNRRIHGIYNFDSNKELNLKSTPRQTAMVPVSDEDLPF